MEGREPACAIIIRSICIKRIKEGTLIKIFAHRGYSSRYPENTEIAFEKALELGCDGIETDVQLSRDGVPVLIHDERVERTSRGPRVFVRDLLYEELLAFDFSARKPGSYSPQRIMTLKELLRLIKASGRDITLNLELKNSIFPYPGLEDIMLREIYEFEDSIDILYSSFNHESIHLLNSMRSGMNTAPLVGKAIPGLAGYVKALGSRGVHPAAKFLTEAMLDELLQAGLFVNVFTVNSLNTAKRYKNHHVSGIFTDRCVEFKEELDNGKKFGTDQTRWSKTKSHRTDHRSL